MLRVTLSAVLQTKPSWNNITNEHVQEKRSYICVVLLHFALFCTEKGEIIFKHSINFDFFLVVLLLCYAGFFMMIYVWLDGIKND